MYSKELLKGTLSAIILKLLSEQERMYGYEMSQKVKELSDGKILLKDGSLYPALQRMTATKWLRAEWGTTETGRKARFYTLTPAGRRQLAEEEQRWDRLTEAVNRALRFA